MPSCCLYYWDNGVGVRTDVNLMKESLDKDFKCSIFDFSCLSTDTPNIFDASPSQKYDIGIWVQNYGVQFLDNNKVNILIVNEEWLALNETEDLNKNFDHIIVKSEYANKLLHGLHKSVNTLYFWSRDLYLSGYSNTDDETILHFAGRSIQKNTECLVNNDDIHIFDNTGRFSGMRSNQYYTDFISDSKLQHVFNTCNKHVCPSLYEAHGHYMFEGMLCDKQVIVSKIPVWEEQIDPDYITFVDVKSMSLCNSNYTFLEGKDGQTTYPFRRGFFVDPDEVEVSIGLSNHKKPRKYILDLFEKNKKAFISFLKNV